MWWGLGIIGAIIWIAVAFWPARVAGRKGHSFFGYFCLSLLFFPARADPGVRGGGPLESCLRLRRSAFARALITSDGASPTTFLTAR